MCKGESMTKPTFVSLRKNENRSYNITLGYIRFRPKKDEQ